MAIRILRDPRAVPTYVTDAFKAKLPDPCCCFYTLQTNLKPSSITTPAQSQLSFGSGFHYLIFVDNFEVL